MIGRPADDPTSLHQKVLCFLDGQLATPLADAYVVLQRRFPWMDLPVVPGLAGKYPITRSPSFDPTCRKVETNANLTDDLTLTCLAPGVRPIRHTTMPRRMDPRFLCYCQWMSTEWTFFCNGNANATYLQFRRRDLAVSAKRTSFVNDKDKVPTTVL